MRFDEENKRKHAPLNGSDVLRGLCLLWLRVCVCGAAAPPADLDE